MERTTILEEAEGLVHGDRNSVYGHPLDDYTTNGKVFAALLTHYLNTSNPGLLLHPISELPAEVVIGLMVAVKTTRLMSNPEHHDTVVDIAGYAECAAWSTHERAKRKEEAIDAMLGIKKPEPASLLMHKHLGEQVTVIKSKAKGGGTIEGELTIQRYYVTTEDGTQIQIAPDWKVIPKPLEEPEPTFSSVTIYCPATVAECDQPCVGSVCNRLKPAEKSVDDPPKRVFYVGQGILSNVAKCDCTELFKSVTATSYANKLYNTLTAGPWHDNKVCALWTDRAPTASEANFCDHAGTFRGTICILCGLYVS